MNILELQEALEAAQKEARKPVAFKLLDRLATPVVADNARAAADLRTKELVENVKLIDANIEAMYSELAARMLVEENRIKLLNDAYLVAPEKEAAELLSQINSAINSYDMLQHLDPALNNAKYDGFKKDRNDAVLALSEHLNIVAALSII